MSERNFEAPMDEDDAGIEGQPGGTSFLGEFGERETGDRAFSGEHGERMSEVRANESREAASDERPM
jgi:hypothetical protein